MTTDWYQNRDDLEDGMVFETNGGDTVKLDRRVPGDGTKWYVADWCGQSWAYMDTTVEPADLKTLLRQE